jgi:hypothetical protein
MSDLSVHNATKKGINMKNITRIFVVCAALFACSSLFAAPATGKGHHHTGKGYHQSGVTGQVVVAGIIPFIPFADSDVLVTSGDGQFVTDFLTDADGNFEVDLKPGTYVLVAYMVFVPLHSPWFGTPVTVTVDKKHFVTVVLPLSFPTIAMR